LRAAVARSCADAKLSDPVWRHGPPDAPAFPQVRTAVENSALAFSVLRVDVIPAAKCDPANNNNRNHSGNEFRLVFNAPVGGVFPPPRM